MTAIMSMDQQIASWREEILGYLEDMKQFHAGTDIKGTLRRLSALSARCTEIRMRIVRSPDKRAQTFRTQEIDYFLAEIDRQYKIWSRVGALMESEWEYSMRS